MNLLDATVSTHGSAVVVTSDAPGVVGTLWHGSTPDLDVVLGVRPEHVVLRGGSGLRAAVTVEDVENLGSELLVHLRLGGPDGRRITARTGRDELVRPGETLEARVAVEHVHLFDRATGRRLEWVADPVLARRPHRPPRRPRRRVRNPPTLKESAMRATSRRRHRYAPLSLVAALTTLGLTGCAVSGAAGTAETAAAVPTLTPDQKVSIVFESYNLLQAGLWTDTINGLIADFEAEHPNITVEAQPTQGASSASTNAVGSVQTQMLAGNAPDVAQLTFDSLDFAATELKAVPLDQIAGEDGVEDALGGEYPMHERAAALGEWDGHLYGMPYVFSTPVLFYNQTALEAAGLPADTPLSTWDDVAAAATTVTAATGKPSLAVSCSVKGGSWCMQGIIRSAGGHVLSEDRSTIEFGEPGAVTAVSGLRSLYDQGVLVNQDSATQMESFGRGDTVFQLQTSALQSSYMGAAKAGGWTLAAAPMPSFGDTPTVPTNSGSALFVFSSDPAKQRAAWEFVTFMTSAHAYARRSPPASATSRCAPV